MLQFSLPLGRWFGVRVRAHFSLLLLLALSAGYAAVATGSIERGFALWLVFLAALAVREIARGITAAYTGLSLRALLLLPIGGVMAFGPRHGSRVSPKPRLLAAVGSAANFVVALLLLGFSYGIDPHVHLFAQPWITVEHILRSAIWLQVAVGVANLVPTGTAPAPRAATAETGDDAVSTPSLASTPGKAPARALFGISTAFALAMVFAGAIAGLLWPVLLGLTLLFTSYLTRATGAVSAEAMVVDVREVMLTELKPLSASSTLRDALRQTAQTAQELFPVLRGERLVGWISRNELSARLRAEGDGFLQGAMSRSLQAVEPGEKLGEALRRATSLGASEFIPVVEGNAMVGLLTPTSLERAVGQLRQTRRSAEREEA